MIRRLVTGLIAAALSASTAFAQSSPGWTYGQVPTPAQWNAAFAAKQDIIGLTTYLLLTGGTMTGKIITNAPSLSAAGLNLPQGTAPSGPINGDLYATSSGLFAQIASVNYNLTSGSRGIDTTYGYAAPATGATVTLAASAFNDIIDPAGTIATLTVNMPASPVDGQIKVIRFGQIVTTLTLSGNGNSIVGNPSAASVGLVVNCLYRSTNTKWYC